MSCTLTIRGLKATRETNEHEEIYAGECHWRCHECGGRLGFYNGCYCLLTDEECANPGLRGQFLSEEFNTMEKIAMEFEETYQKILAHDSEKEK